MRDLYDYLNDVEIDFSVYTEESLTKKERNMMKRAVTGKRKISTRKICTIAACVAAAAVLGASAYATGFVDNVIKMISTGHNEFYQYSYQYAPSEESMEMEMPPELKGLFFHADGTEADTLSRGEEYYDRNGNKIEDMAEYISGQGISEITVGNEEIKIKIGGSDKLEDRKAEMRERDAYTIAEKPEDIIGLAFAPRLPQYLPEGFCFDFAAYYEEYLFVFYRNADGEYFMVHERIINDDTAYAAGTNGAIEETTIGGNKAVITDDRNIDWESGDISLSVSGRGVLSRDELIKVAESM